MEGGHGRRLLILETILAKKDVMDRHSVVVSFLEIAALPQSLVYLSLCCPYTFMALGFTFVVLNNKTWISLSVSVQLF